jgi:arginine exporter protein ArgO
MTAADGAVFVAGAFLASLSWQTLVAAVGALAGRRLRPAWRTALSVLGNLVILGFAVVILFG